MRLRSGARRSPQTRSSRADLLVLAHKPAQLEAISREIGAVPLVLSLLGGVTVAAIESVYPGARVVRAMPNTAVEVRRGVTCICGVEVRAVEELLARVGTVVRLAERLMDAATAVSGVAPAYVALIAEAWVDAAVGQGIPAAQAAELVADSLAGSAALLLAHHMDTLAVRRAVTSPGGMTARGLRALEQAGLRSAFSTPQRRSPGRPRSDRRRLGLRGSRGGLHRRARVGLLLVLIVYV